MPAVSFFALIFSSLLWFIFALKFVLSSLGNTPFFAAGTSNILAYICIVCLPVFLIWLVFSYVNQYLQNKTVNQQLYKLFGQMKKNQDYSDLLARVLIETEQQVKDGFMLGKFDLLVAERTSGRDYPLHQHCFQRTNRAFVEQSSKRRKVVFRKSHH